MKTGGQNISTILARVRSIKPLTSNNYRGTCTGSTLQFSSSVPHRARMTWKKRLQQRQITITVIAEPALLNSCSSHVTPTQHISIAYLCRPNTTALLQHAHTHKHTQSALVKQINENVNKEKNAHC